MTHEMKGPEDDRADRDLDALLAEVRRSYHRPPEPPLELMWDRIETGRHDAPSAPPVVSRYTRSARLAWWVGLAAALVVGIGIGRLTRPQSAVIASAEPRTDALAFGGYPRAPRTGAGSAPIYDATTTRYLGQTAALLIALPAEARAGRPDRRFVARAEELLTTTRLLLDSPAAADPKVRALLEDIELVLAQVAHLEVDRGHVEYEMITQALEQRDLLPRLHSAAAESAGADD